MNQDNRVLGRKGARELTAIEVEGVNGAIIIRTNSACFLSAKGGAFVMDSTSDGCLEQPI